LKNNELSMVSTQEAAKQLGVELHQICFSEIYHTTEPKLNWKQIADRLREAIDPDLQIRPVNCLEINHNVIQPIGWH